MKKIFLIFAAFSMSACGLLEAPAGVSPAPLAKVVIDDKGLRAAWETLEVLTDAVTLLRTTGVLKPGTTPATTIATGLVAAKHALIAAEHAAAAGSSPDYTAALLEARAAYDMIRTALKGL